MYQSHSGGKLDAFNRSSQMDLSQREHLNSKLKSL